MRNNTQVINDFLRLLREARRPFSRNIHLGPGEEERPEVERRARSPPLIAVKSVVYRSADRDRDLVALLVSRGMHLRWLTS